VRFDRLVLSSLAAADRQVALALHPDLTVVTGLGPLERAGLVSDLVGSLGPSRPGVHVELRADDGRRFAIFRPADDVHRVVDVDGRRDVTEDFTDGANGIDLLARAGLDEREARRALCVTAEDLTGEATDGERLQRLAAADQQELWPAAEAVVRHGVQLEQVATEVGGQVEDAEVIASIEERHERFEQAQEESERVRRATFMIAGIAALLSFPLVRLVGDLVVVPLAVIAGAAVVASFVTWRRSERARTAEAEALEVAGATSYLGFHLQRVNSLLGSDLGRQRFLAAAQAHRDALARWRELAGDVPAEWAIDHRRAVEASAVATSQTLAFAERDRPDGRAGETVGALVARLESLRRLGDTEECFPALLDEPFSGVDDRDLPTLLEALVSASRHQQVVLLTDDPRIGGWASAEALTGSLAVCSLQPAVAAGPR